MSSPLLAAANAKSDRMFTAELLPGELSVEHKMTFVGIDLTVNLFFRQTNHYRNSGLIHEALKDRIVVAAHVWTIALRNLTEQCVP